MHDQIDRGWRTIDSTDSDLPGYQRAVANTQQLLDEIATEFGLLTREEAVARGQDPESWLWVERNGERLYPGFWARDSDEVPTVIYQLAKVAEEVGWSGSSAILWLCSPSGSFHGDRPIDHLGESNLVAIAKTDW